MDNASKARRFTINKWGLASLVLFVGDYLVWACSFHQEDIGHPLFSRITGYGGDLLARFHRVASAER